MKINKDLVDAVMMVSFISLVLIGTTDFSNATEKKITMVIVAVIVISMLILRILRAKLMSNNS